MYIVHIMFFRHDEGTFFPKPKVKGSIRNSRKVCHTFLKNNQRNSRAIEFRFKYIITYSNLGGPRK